MDTPDITTETLAFDDVADELDEVELLDVSFDVVPDDFDEVELLDITFDVVADELDEVDDVELLDVKFDAVLKEFDEVTLLLFDDAVSEDTTHDDSLFTTNEVEEALTVFVLLFA